MTPASASSLAGTRPAGRRHLTPLAIGVFIALLAWAAGCFGLAWYYRGDTESLLCIVLGSLVLILALIGFFRAAMALPLGLSVLLTGAAMLTAGVVLSEVVVAVGGMIVIVLIASAAFTVLARPAPDVQSPSPERATVEHLLRELIEHAMLSDPAKRVLFRERETTLLREAIEHDVAIGRLDSALAICNEMGSSLGLVEEAEGYRSRILAAQQEQSEAQLRKALDRFELLAERREFGAAMREAASIRRLFSASHPLPDFEARLNDAQAEHKRELEQRFLALAQNGDAEGAMSLLKTLDRYLTRSEAEGLAEVARGVVGRHRENLGVRFRMALNEHRWADAIEAGEAITAEFPNTRMAREVLAVIDVLRQRAAGTGSTVRA